MTRCRADTSTELLDTSAEIPLPPGEGGPFGFAQGKLRPGEGRVINPSAAHGAVI